PADGFLQDVHWSVGIFGYFPTYTLGNIYAACLWDAIEQRLPSLDADLASGNLARILDWLGRHVHRQGARLTAEALIEAATGSGPDAAPLLSYLAGKASKSLIPACLVTKFVENPLCYCILLFYREPVEFRNCLFK
ncbi:MAG: hypothetical protein AAF653_15570, partial [Chloroflexota bacterium]